MNQELRDLFVADQTEPRRDKGPDTPEYREMRERDAQRRRRVSELLAQGGVSAPDDYFHAALIFQHGEHWKRSGRPTNWHTRLRHWEPPNRWATKIAIGLPLLPWTAG